MGCELPTIKYSVFLFNTISALLGIGTTVVSVLALENYQNEGRTICIFMILFGSIVILISFFGCCGAFRENICLTWICASCLLVLIVGNAVIIFNYLNRMDGETKARQDINNAWKLQLSGKDGMANIQTSFKCCGINNSTDYIDANMTIPNSCFVDGNYEKSTILFSHGCLAKLIAIYEASEHWMTIFVWSSLNMELAAFISNCALAITITNQKRRARY